MRRVWRSGLVVAVAVAAGVGCGSDDDGSTSATATEPARDRFGYAVYEGQGVRFAYPDATGWTVEPANVGEGMQAEGPPPPDLGAGARPRVSLTGRNPYDSDEEAFESYRDDAGPGFELVSERPVELEGALGARVFVTESRLTRRGGAVQTLEQSELFFAREAPEGRIGWELSVTKVKGERYPDTRRVLDSLEVTGAP